MVEGERAQVRCKRESANVTVTGEAEQTFPSASHGYAYIYHHPDGHYSLAYTRSYLHHGGPSIYNKSEFDFDNHVRNASPSPDSFYSLARAARRNVISRTIDTLSGL